MSMNTPNFEIEKYRSAYTEKGLLRKISRLAKRGGERIVYLALLLYYVLVSSEVSLGTKGAILGALGYLILPIDMIPDFLPVAGYTDDFAALVAAYNMIKGSLTPGITAKAEKRCRELFKDFDMGAVEAEISKEEKR